MVVSKKIKEARKRLNLTQEALAKAVGVKRSVISKYETGAIVPSIDMLENISKNLGVPVGELMGLEDMGGGFWGKEADPETYIKIAENIEKHHPAQKVNPAEEQSPHKILKEIGEAHAPTDDERLKMNCSALFSYMEKMNRAGQAVLVQTAKTLSGMPEYQKKDEPGQK